ncbi:MULTISPECIES: hypothetical protein [unclassified Moorena]|uniref:hypothetical protein n=1 Tax=unclassified Moorena TaxID=2683338 RepID=UPI0013BED503|nr:MULTISPECIES: hypothetical protein [unclassified Moorena]NEO05653.1 hypothetical protein [Moorena sp. SIO3I8]NEP26474.1 hypothetical protein [Moorena sp. SIO3I6]
MPVTIDSRAGKMPTLLLLILGRGQDAHSTAIDPLIQQHQNSPHPPDSRLPTPDSPLPILNSKF